MTSKILRIIQTSIAVAGICALSGCAERNYYGGGSGPDYAYARPYESGPSYYPRTYVAVPENRVIVEHPIVAREHDEHERHEAIEHHEDHAHHEAVAQHDTHENHAGHDHDDQH